MPALICLPAVAVSVQQLQVPCGIRPPLGDGDDVVDLGVRDLGDGQAADGAEAGAGCLEEPLFGPLGVDPPPRRKPGLRFDTRRKTLERDDEQTQLRMCVQGVPV